MRDIPHLVEYFNSFLTGVLSKFGDFVTRLTDGGYAKCTCAAEDYDVEQGVGSCSLDVIGVGELTDSEFFNDDDFVDYRKMWSF